MQNDRLHVNQQGPSPAKRNLALVLNTAQSSPPEVEYRPPTPISLRGTPSPDGGNSGSSATGAPSLPPEPARLPVGAHPNHRFPFIYPKRRVTDTAPKAHEDVSVSLKDRQCPVCLRRGCILVSHKRYASRKKSSPPQRLGTVSKPPQLSFTLSIGNARVDPFFDLPIGNSDPEMQRQFRDFFTSQCSSMTDPVRIRAFDSAYCPILIRQALADPALCHTYIAMAATYSAIHGQSLQAPDAKLFSIFDRTFRVLRQQISQNRRAKPSDSLIMAAINLLMCHGLAFGDRTAIAAHPVALKNLVDACGGIANLSSQPASLTLWADFYVTLYTGQKPTFLEQAAVMPDIPLSNSPPVMYGGSLDGLVARGLISPALLNVCQNTCRLTELLEDRVAGNANPARWEYFNYKRNTMAMRNGTMHAALFASGTKAECIGLVHNLFLFLVLRLMPWKVLILNLCDQLRTALVATGLQDYWRQDRDVLLWVLFMLLAGAEQWRDKQWALRLLSEMLSNYYGCKAEHWPPDWCEMQRLNLMRFTWSEIYLTASFTTTCREVVMINQSPVRVLVEEQQEEPLYSPSRCT